MASGLIYLDDGSYTIVRWDGKGVPDVIAKFDLIQENFLELDYPFGIWSRKQFEYQKAGMQCYESFATGGCSKIWPYIVTKRCKGRIFADL